MLCAHFFPHVSLSPPRVLLLPSFPPFLSLRPQHFWTMRAEAILDQLNIAEADREAFLAKHTLSPGYFTLEFALPSPPPVHCFTEPPVVKETV